MDDADSGGRANGLRSIVALFAKKNDAEESNARSLSVVLHGQ